MPNIGVPRYTARHSGKSGFVTIRPVGAPKPFPFSFVEDAITNTYPEYRKYIPEDYREISDSYYDLRSKPYREWYDKWGKRHINKYWEQQLDAIQKYEKAKARFFAKGFKTKNPTYYRRTEWYHKYQNTSSKISMYSKRYCRKFPEHCKRRGRPRQRGQQWFRSRKYYTKRSSKRYY